MGGAPSTTTWRGVTVDPATAAYLDAVAAEVTVMAKAAGVPDFTVAPIPGCGSYQTSTAASAGTHAGGGAVDINAEALTDAQARILEAAARKWGGTAWFRPRVSPAGIPYGWQRHVHILRSDCGDLAAAARTQVGQYRRGLNGLANNGPDTGDRTWVDRTWGAVKGLAATIGAIGATTAQEDDMTPEQAKRLDDIYAAVAGFRSEEAGRYVVDANRYKWTAGVLSSIAGKVGATVDEQAIAAQVLAGIAPAVSDAVKAAVAAGVPAEQLADAVVAKLGQRLAPPA